MDDDQDKEYADAGDDDDDIARFERECRARAKAEGRLVDSDGEEADDAASDAGDEVINNARLLQPTMHPSSGGTPSGGGGTDWQKKCELLELRLVQRNDEIKKLKNDVELLQTEDVGSGVITELKQKLLELTKRNRRITVNNESLKSKVKDLEIEKRNQHKELEKQTLAALEDACPGLGELQEYKTKFLQASNQLQEVRSQMSELNANLQKQKKVLLKELGSDEAFQKAMKAANDPNSSDWRGREAKVAQLQRQVKDLKEQLRNAPQDASEGTPSQARERRGEAPHDGEMTLNPKESKAHEKISDLASQRRAELEEAKKQVDQLKVENADLKKKHVASKSRTGVLEDQLRQLKVHVQTLLAKSDNDDSLVETLRRQLGRHGPSGGDDGEAEVLRQQIDEQQSQLDRQAQIILSLKQQRLSDAHKNGSMKLGPEGSADMNHIIERVRFLEAENAKQAEHIRLNNGTNDGRPCSAESTLKGSQSGLKSRLAELERENRILRENTRDATDNQSNEVLVKQNDALKREIIKLRSQQQQGLAE